jgi:hypothetical protein
MKTSESVEAQLHLLLIRALDKDDRPVWWPDRLTPEKELPVPVEWADMWAPRADLNRAISHSSRESNRGFTACSLVNVATELPSLLKWITLN